MEARLSGSNIAVASLAALILILVIFTPSPKAQASSIGSYGAGCDTSQVTSGIVTCGGGAGGCLISPGSDYVPSVGYCEFVNYTDMVTFYTSNAGNGEIKKSLVNIAAANPIPVIGDVIGTNNRFAPYLITCPLAPQPTNSIEYISDPYTYIAGNRCLASIGPLNTEVSLTTSVLVISIGAFFNYGSKSDLGNPPTYASQSYSISGMASGSVKNIGFSGQASVGGSAYNISSAYNTKSYIFQGVNSTPQQGLWTWTSTTPTFPR